MNKTLSTTARNLIKSGLMQCSEAQRYVFKYLYVADDSYDVIDINTVVDNIPDDKLDWALTQVENTITKNIKRDVEYNAKVDNNA